MRKLIFILAIIFFITSCDIAPTITYQPTFKVLGRDWDLYWQMIKDGDVDTGEYQHYPVNNKIFYDIEQGVGYTLRFYRVTSTIIDGDVEKRIIGDTYETHIVIDHWYTTICPTYTKEDGLGCKVEKSELII